MTLTHKLAYLWHWPHYIISYADMTWMRDFNDVVLDPNHTHEVGVLDLGPPRTAEHGAAKDRCNEMARLMWAQYQATLENRA